jgi:hypothetical protein
MQGTNHSPIARLIFHKEMFEKVYSINRLMKRADHEDGATEKSTYCSLADQYNNELPDIAMDFIDSDVPSDIEGHVKKIPAFIAADPSEFITTSGDGKPFKKFKKEMFGLQNALKT